MLETLLNASRRTKRSLSVIADSLFIILAFWAAMSLRLDEAYLDFDAKQLGVISVTIATSIFFFVRLGLYRAVIRFMSNHAMMAVFIGASFSGLVLASMGFLVKAFIPRSVPFMYWCFVLLMVGGSRMLVRAYLHNKLVKPKEKVVIYGAGHAGVQLAIALSQGSDYQPVLYVDDDKRKQGSIVQGLHVYSPTELAELIKDYKVKKVLLAISDAPQSAKRFILRFLEPFPVEVLKIPSFTDLIEGKSKIQELRSVEIEDLLGRDCVEPDIELMLSCAQHKNVMVTGAGGSIGSELCRQLIRLSPTKLVLLEQSEFALYEISKVLSDICALRKLKVDLVPILGSVTNKDLIGNVVANYSIHTLYHAAAYKHVPIVERNSIEGAKNNVLGTYYAALAARTYGVEKFVLISTDKAVKPVNVMGQTKRAAEIIVRKMAEKPSNTTFCSVRFGNVLGSSGSVVPLFRDQIKKGGPVTVTHPDVTRFFMTIPEAAQLVIQAGGMAEGDGEVFVLDMGTPIKIKDLAYKMVHLMGLDVRDDDNPDGNIEIVYTGLRQGEKLHEQLFDEDDGFGTSHSRIWRARQSKMRDFNIDSYAVALHNACESQLEEVVKKLLIQIVGSDAVQDQGYKSVALTQYQGNVVGLVK
ncbi:polysaccharide biosynthesis protein [Hahella sp. CR1]|uniref:polysaccharide biosynthesis protein n=1 Tax=Hahella sp. CR1 TaxID=2992807 RepID=UPI0024412757|nr:nucleoside-diphosphate sugar epimerase/dehydratase [Hahella sp. CR1]MDG9667323.1 polysaccharide biosynthesis protein [Hahella sp. CR1]